MLPSSRLSRDDPCVLHSLVSAKHCSNMDLGGAIQTLVVATTFIKSALDIYTLLKKEIGRDPNENELVIRITSRKDLPHKLNKHTQEQITKAIVRKLGKNK